MSAIKTYVKDFWFKKDPDQNQRLKSILYYVFPVVIIHFALYKGLYSIGTLSIDSYFNNSISLELLKKILQNIYFIIVLIIAVAVFRKKLFLSWTSFESGKIIKRVVVIIALILAWYYSSYDYNFYFNQSHIFDRVLLVCFALAIYYRPIFILPFLLLLFSIMMQFASFPYYSTGISPFLLIRILILFLAFVVYKLLFKRFELSIFVFLLCCLIGTHYFTPGYGKLNSEWIFNDHINYLIAATYPNGWLSFLNESSISSFIQFLDTFNGHLRVFTLIVECGVLFFFFHLKYLRFILTCAIVMHLGILMYSGIFFWMWILLHLTLLFILFKKDLPIHNIFNRYYFIAGLFLIGLGKFWASAGALSWLDSPLSYTYVIEAKTEDGEVLNLHPNFFSCYDYQFSLGNFKYLNEEPRLNIVWGATDQSTSHYLNSERSVKEIFEHETENGKIYKDEKSKQIFVDFIKKFIGNRNKNLKGEDNYTKYLQAPELYWSFPYDLPSKVNQKITEVTVNEITTYFTENEGFKIIRKKKVLHLIMDL